MGRGGHGGRSPTPNDDRSRSMNSQDPVGQAAMANTARQRGDDDYDDDYDDGIFEEVGEEPNQDTETGIYFGEISREESEKPQETKPKLVFEDLCFYGYDGGYGWNNLKAKPKSKDE